MAGKKDSKQERKRIDSVTKKILQQDAARQRYESGRPEDLPLQSEDWKFALGMAGLSGLSKAIPAVGAELAAYGPLYRQAAKTLLTDIPAFETIDRMPTLWGRGRLTQEVGSGVERGVRAVLPDGRVEDIVAPALGTVAGFAAGIPVGGVSHLMARNADNVLNATADAANRIMQDNVVRRATRSMLPVEDVYGYGNGAVSSLVEAPVEQAASTPLYQAYRESIGMPERFANPWVGFRSPSHIYAEPTFNYIEGMTPMQRAGVNIGLNPGDPGYVDLDLNRIAAGVNMRTTARRNIDDYISRLGQARWPRDIRPADLSRYRHYDRFLNFNLPETSRNYRPMAVDPRTRIMDDAAAVTARQNAVTRTGRRQEAVRRSYRESAEEDLRLLQRDLADYRQRAGNEIANTGAVSPDTEEALGYIQGEIANAERRVAANAPARSVRTANTQPVVSGELATEADIDAFLAEEARNQALDDAIRQDVAEQAFEFSDVPRSSNGLLSPVRELSDAEFARRATPAAASTVSTSPTSVGGQLAGVGPQHRIAYDIMYERTPEEIAEMVRATGRNVNSISDLSSALREIENEFGSREALLEGVRRGSLSPTVSGNSIRASLSPSGYNTPTLMMHGNVPFNPAEIADLNDEELTRAYFARMSKYIKGKEYNGQYTRDYGDAIERDAVFRGIAKEMQKRFGEGLDFNFGNLAGTEYDKMALWMRSPDSPYSKAGAQYILPGDIRSQLWEADAMGMLNGSSITPAEAARRLYQSIPRGSALATTYPYGSTSIDSNPLPIHMALENYGTGAGQSSVVPFFTDSGAIDMSGRNSMGFMSDWSKKQLLDDFATAGRDARFSSVPIDFNDRMQAVDFESFLNGDPGVSSDKAKLFRDFVKERLSKRRNNILLKLDRPWSKVSAKEGWAPDYIPKARIRTDIDKEVRDILDEFASGSSYVSLETPESASYITIKHNLGGPLLLKPYAGGGGLSRSKDYKSSKKPYPSVKSGDFAGGGRSYPIPTKADAVDALRLAGLHHRPDVKAKVYAKYPSLKHADGGPLDNGIDYSGIETTNNRKYNPDYISYIDSALANAQLPDAKRASILANIIEESGGDPFALDSTGKFYGLLQWADDRYSPTGELDPYREIDNQVANIVNTLGNTTDGKSWTHGGTGSGYNSYKDAMADFDNEDLATAMKGFTLGYVRPSGKIDSYNNRLKVAQQILDKYNNPPEKKAATLIEKMKAAFGNDTEAMQRLINAAKSSGGFR